MKKFTLCSVCKTGIHTAPPNGSYNCQCGTRICACYGIQVAAGIRKDRSELLK